MTEGNLERWLAAVTTTEKLSENEVKTELHGEMKLNQILIITFELLYAAMPEAGQALVLLQPV